MIDFTFIIPVYNAENTIERCLESVRVQNYDNFEVIVMDDGSKDQSYEKCMKYQIEDSRFRIFQQENAGPSAARNQCLKYAKGNWICFVDSDDTIDSNYLMKLSRVIEQNDPDAIFIGYRRITEKITESRIPQIVDTNYYKIIASLSRQDMFGYTWIKILKKECVEEINFVEGLNLFEDEIFTCQVLKKCRKIQIVEDTLYNYYVDSVEALTKKTYKDYCKKCDTVFEAWKELVKDATMRDDILKERAEILFNACKYYGLEKPVKVKEFYSQLAETEFVKYRTPKRKFEQYIAEENYNMLRLEKAIYNFKVAISKMVRHSLGN